MPKPPPLTLRTVRDKNGTHTTAYALVDEERTLVCAFPVSRDVPNHWKLQRGRAIAVARLINDMEGREHDKDFRRQREEVARRNERPVTSIIDPGTGRPYRGG
jgi:hypothetical protein